MNDIRERTAVQCIGASIVVFFILGKLHDFCNFCLLVFDGFQKYYFRNYQPIILEIVFREVYFSPKANAKYTSQYMVGDYHDL